MSSLVYSCIACLCVCSGILCVCVCREKHSGGERNESGNRKGTCVCVSVCVCVCVCLCACVSVFGRVRAHACWRSIHQHCKLFNGVCIPAQVAMSIIIVRYHCFSDRHV